MTDSGRDATDPSPAQIEALVALVRARGGFGLSGNRESWSEVRVIGGDLVEVRGEVFGDEEVRVRLDPREVWQRARQVARAAAGIRGPVRPGQLSAEAVIAHLRRDG